MATGNVIHIYKTGNIDTTTDNKYTLNTNTSANISKILYIDDKVVRIISYQNGKFKTKTGAIVNGSIPIWNDTTLDDNTNTSYIKLYENIDTKTQVNLQLL